MVIEDPPVFFCVRAHIDRHFVGVPFFNEHWHDIDRTFSEEAIGMVPCLIDEIFDTAP